MPTNHKAKVFIAGSRRISRLNKEVHQRIKNVTDKGLTILVGDANGVDKAVQQFLRRIAYEKVIVFCMQGSCRNNIGDWRTQTVVPPAGVHRGFEYYAEKDKAMSAEADFGLMLWDGNSRGTFRSAIDLVGRGKPTVMYVAPLKSFWSLRDISDLERLLQRVDPGHRYALEADLPLAIHGAGSRHKNQTTNLF